MLHKYLKALIIIAALGILATGYLTYSHFSDSTPVCLFDSSNSCSAVTQSVFSAIAGIPVAIIGFLTWIIIFASAVYAHKHESHEHSVKNSLYLIVAVSLIGIMAAGYFNGIMFLKLNAICTWCELSHLLMITTFVLSSTLLLGKQYVVKIIMTLLILFIVMFWYASRTTYDPQIDVFAKCLTEKNVTFYGAFWCPHCQNQKALFGSSIQFVNYVECSVPDRSAQTQICVDAKIKSYPTWEFGDGTKQTGELSFSQLALLSGCPAP